jgi:hypothetical protein
VVTFNKDRHSCKEIQARIPVFLFRNVIKAPEKYPVWLTPAFGYSRFLFLNMTSRCDKAAFIIFPPNILLEYIIVKYNIKAICFLNTFIKNIVVF